MSSALPTSPPRAPASATPLDGSSAPPQAEAQPPLPASQPPQDAARTSTTLASIPTTQLTSPSLTSPMGAALLLAGQPATPFSAAAGGPPSSRSNPALISPALPSPVDNIFSNHPFPIFFDGVNGQRQWSAHPAAAGSGNGATTAAAAALPGPAPRMTPLQTRLHRNPPIAFDHPLFPTLNRPHRPPDPRAGDHRPHALLLPSATTASHQVIASASPLPRGPFSASVGTGTMTMSSAQHHAWPPYLRNPDRAGTRYPFLNIPTQWSVKDRSSFIDLPSTSAPFLVAHYNGPGEGDKDAAAVRADAPVYAPGGIYYYEVLILSKGKEGFISVGLSGPKVALNRLPGWEHQSWGYHGDDGNQFSCSGNGISYGPRYTSNDVIGCCINYHAKEIFYTKNGHRLPPAHLNMPWEKMTYLYPTIGLRTRGEAVQANFGSEPFRYNIGLYVREQQSKVMALVNATPLIPPKSPASPISPSYPTKHHSSRARRHSATVTDEPMETQTSAEATTNTADEETSETHLLASVVCRYLIQCGYLSTAAALRQSAHLHDHQDLIATNDNIRRKEIVDALRQQDSKRAVELVHQNFARLPTSNLDAWLDLRCAEFLDQVQACTSATGAASSAPHVDADGISDAWLDVIQAGQRLWDEFGVEQLKGQREQRLQEIFSIIAYVDAEHSPVAYLLDPAHREEICNRVNRALLEYSGYPPLTNLESITKAAAVALEEAACVGQAASSLVDLDQLLMEA